MKAGRQVVYVVDDDDSFLRSVARLLRAAGHEVVAFDSASAFLESINPEIAGCVVLDLQMPGCSGLEVQAALEKTGDPLPVIFLTGRGDIPSTVQAMRGGAEDFLTKLAPQQELLAAVKRALAREARERERRRSLGELRSRFNTLTAREREVLSHVVEGKMNKQIADALKINERTVKLHRTSITRKLEARSVAELTRMVGEAGLFPKAERVAAGEGGGVDFP